MQLPFGPAALTRKPRSARSPPTIPMIATVCSRCASVSARALAPITAPSSGALGRPRSGAWSPRRNHSPQVAERDRRRSATTPENLTVGSLTCIATPSAPTLTTQHRDPVDMAVSPEGTSAGTLRQPVVATLDPAANPGDVGLGEYLIHPYDGRSSAEPIPAPSPLTEASHVPRPPGWGPSERAVALGSDRG